MGMTLAEFNELQLRLDAKRGTRSEWNENVQACEDESKLHADILQDCRRRGWLAFHGAMSHRTHRTPGEPDFVVLGPAGCVLLVECKAKGRKLTTEQAGVAIWAERLGHTLYVVRCFEDWLGVLRDKNLCG
jgi:hypothetical protein